MNSPLNHCAIHHARRRHAAGFTLIEIMVALAVLGTALFILLETHYTALHAQETLRYEVQMRNLMADALGMAEVEVGAGNFTGNLDFGRRYAGYSYSYDAQPLGEGFAGLYDVLIKVKGPTETRERHIYLMTRDQNSLLQGMNLQDGSSTQTNSTGTGKTGSSSSLPSGIPSTGL